MVKAGPAGGGWSRRGRPPTKDAKTRHRSFLLPPREKMICTPSFYRGETNAHPSSYPERRERRGLSHPTGMESNVQKQKCIIGPCDLMSTHPQQIRQERNRADVGGLNDLSFVRCDALALLPATAVISCLLRRSIRGGGGGAGPTVTCPPPSMRPIRHGEYPCRVGGGRAPRDPASPPTTDPLPSPGSATAAAAAIIHGTSHPSPCHVTLQSGRSGEASCRASDPTRGGKEPGSGLPGPGVERVVRFGRLSVIVGGRTPEFNL